MSDMANLGRRIQQLPKDVVDRIAAGEVVQRPCNVVKELIENSLDAGSTSIMVHVENGGIQKLQVIDNGCGIPKEDLGLAATRFATSKLRSVDDFDTLASFGFRGEALASMSLVARLQIVSRRSECPMAFLQNYIDGAPASKEGCASKPTPQARTPGTTVTVSDLFYNIPHRKKMKESDEYNKILNVVQSYAIQYSNVSFVCRKLQKNKQVVDFNTAMLSKVKALQDPQEPETDVMLKDEAIKEVLVNVFGAGLKNHILKVKSNAADNCHYDCEGFVSDPAYAQSHPTKLVLFINDRLVECHSLKKDLESVYLEFTKSKPLIYLSMHVPGGEVDVNVHPTKKQVTLLHQDEIIKRIQRSLRDALMLAGHNFEQASAWKKNPYSKKRIEHPEANKTLNTRMNSNKRQKQGQSADQSSQLPSSQSPMPMRKTDVVKSSTKVRTSKASPAGALEPYLVEKSDAKTVVEHESSCPLAKEVDLSQPGAFASRNCSCVAVIRKLRQSQVRPLKIVSTKCNYKSIKSLRSHIAKRCCPVLKDQFRKEAIFVGVVSQQRSLVQCGTELQLWNHSKLAESFFQQLALLRFGGLKKAHLGKPVDIERSIGFILELEEQFALQDMVDEAIEISETNLRLAHQASSCLMDQMEMLDEYFSIGIESRDGRAHLTAMPILLEGYVPQQSALPLFLLRLATEVDWTVEKHCFRGITYELGLYYGKTVEQDIHHRLFPALCHTMFPLKRFGEDGTIAKLTVLPALFKRFER